MRTPPDKKIAFVFMSEPTVQSAMRWTARLEFPPGATGDTALPITVVDGDEVPVASARLELAGRQIQIRDGRASMTYAEFVAGKHSTPLWLYRNGMPPVPGGLTFA